MNEKTTLKKNRFSQRAFTFCGIGPAVRVAGARALRGGLRGGRAGANRPERPGRGRAPDRSLQGIYRNPNSVDFAYISNLQTIQKNKLGARLV